MRNLMILDSEVETELIREEDFQGRKYLVTPVIAIVEGVVTPGNIGKPELALMKEFKPTVLQWNGLAAVLNHPQDTQGKEVSANSPEIYNEFAFGLLFNSRIDGNKLKMDAYLDIIRAEELGGEFADCIEKLRSNSLVEVSTGLFAHTLDRTGTFKGNKFEGIWQDIVPDHLAFLPNGRGACNAEMGCGTPRINREVQAEGLLYTASDHEGTLSGFRTLKIPTPSKGEKQDDFHSRCMADKTMQKEYPDQKQRNAVCYSQWRRKKKSSGELTVVDSFSYDGIAGILIDNLESVTINTPALKSGPNTNSHQCSCEDRLRCHCDHNTDNAVTASTNKFMLARTEALKKATPEQRERVEKAIREFIANSEGISDQDLRTAIQLTLSASGERSGIVIAVYDSSFVYVDWWSGQYNEVDYEKDDKGNVTFDLESAVQVRPMTEYVPITVQGEEDMANNNANTQNHNVQQNQQNQTQEQVQPKNLSFAAAIELMSPEAKLIANEGEKLRNERIAELCNTILKAQGNKFTPDDLKGFNRDQLERIASLASAPIVNSAEPKACAKCGDMNTNSAKYCTSCGEKMATQQSQTNNSSQNGNGNQHNNGNQNGNGNNQRQDHTDFRGNNANAGQSGDGSPTNLRNQASSNGQSEDPHAYAEPINLSERIKSMKQKA